MTGIVELFDLAVRNHQSGDLAGAEALYRRILQEDPHNADALHLLGVAVHQMGNHETAVAFINRAIALQPDNPVFRFNLGVAYKEACQLDAAIECYAAALALNPSYVDALCNLGIALEEKGSVSEAAQRFQQALNLNPLEPKVHLNLGLALKKLGKVPGAIACLRRALELNSLYVSAHLNLGILLKDQGQTAEAIESFQSALSLDPGSADAHSNLGVALAAEGRLSEALVCFDNALRINPQFVEAHNNLGTALVIMGRREEGCRHFEEVLKIDPGNESAQCHRAFLHLMHGELKKGWPGYEYRWTQAVFVPRPNNRPVWDGSDLNGKTILVFAEQGLGDTIQFARYLKLLKARGGRVVFECQTCLAELLKDLEGVDELIVSGTPLPFFDVQVPLLSLPRLLGTTLETIPADIPYLRASSERTAFWRAELAPVREKKVGIVWQGSALHPCDRYRSVPLADFELLSRNQKIRLISLQVGTAAQQVAEVGFPVLDLGSRFDNASLEDAAAALCNLDLLIGVDSALAHLAGALGIPVWLLLPVTPDWRWLLDRSDSPWYPTMTLFRQESFVDWQGVFERVAQALDTLT